METRNKPAASAVPLREDSLKKRYAMKLGSNLFGSLGVGLIIQIIVPRGLGPAGLGSFNFLTTFMQQVFSFTDMGMSMAFYTKLSKRQQEKKLLGFYLLLGLVAGLLIALALSIPFLLGLQGMVWPDQATPYIWMAFGFAFLGKFSQGINYIGDAFGYTVPVERVRIVQKIVSLALIVAMFYFGWFSLSNYFFYQYLLFGLLTYMWYRVIVARNKEAFSGIGVSKDEAISYSKEFYHFASPLILFNLISMLSQIGERWLLQTFAGTLEQGYYGFAFNIAGLTAIFTTAMTPLIMREMSVAHGNSDMERMRRLYRYYVPLLFGVATYFSLFTSMQAESITFFFGGEKFAEAVKTVAIMAFFMLFGTYGQLSGTIYYATGRTRLYSALSIIQMVAGILLAYFLIADSGHFGLGLGAVGLSIKMVGMQVVGLFVMLYFDCRYLGLSYIRHLMSKVFMILIMGLTGFFSIGVTNMLVAGRFSAFIISGVLYTGLAMLVVYLLPSILMLDRKEMDDVVVAPIKRLYKQRLESWRSSTLK